MTFKYLVVVESPAKAKTIKRYLNSSDYEVRASYGHVMDLLPKEGAVDTENGFEMHYRTLEKSSRHVDEIVRLFKKSEAIYLATDPDREGEAIAWHICEILKSRKLIKKQRISRISFHEITKTAIQKAITDSQDINMDLVNAQQARRALDFLVGFNLSPLLWRKVFPGLSAGRVQSPALRMIVEREESIEAFESQEYWSIHADLSHDGQAFIARLTHFDNEKLEQFSVTSEKQSLSMTDVLTKEAGAKITLTDIQKKERKRRPAPPFITSTLQQEAARKLGFSAQKTMQIAQQLYEGVELKEGLTGLITYMRTDSVTLAQEAVSDMRSLILETYGNDYLPEEPRTYKTKSKNAQEAHEAIRPTGITHIPKDIKSFVTADQFKLYQLVWKRALACQMNDALMETVAADFSVGSHTFRANGSAVVFPGFLSVYEEGQDDKKSTTPENRLPIMNKGDEAAVEKIYGEQHFTEPPPRFTEATLVKALEECDIGRPSTYANIIATLKKREYVIMDQKRFKATDVGRVVNRFLTTYFTQYVDYNFTATLENQLDEIARGDKEWVPILEEFWSPFKKQVDHIMETVNRSDVTQEKTDEKCPECEKELVIRLGKNGRFVGCSGYPDCRYTRDMDDSGDGHAHKQLVEGRQCPLCSNDLLVKNGRYGKFIGCSGYPDCRHIEPLHKPRDTEVACPQCKKGTILERKSRRGKVFFSCSGYPDCTYAIWNEPIAEPCPTCQWPILSIKKTKKRGTEKICPQKDCSYSLPIEDIDEGDDT